ncbi:hypothetical protein V3C99_015833 [Haemonchus contortus]
MFLCDILFALTNYSCTAEEYAMMVCNQQAALNPKTITNSNSSRIRVVVGQSRLWCLYQQHCRLRPNFEYTVFSQLVSGYTVSIGCTDTCYGQKQVYCAFDVCTAMTYFGYEVGSGPCMVDGDCTTFPGSTCNTKNGLCVKNPNTPLCPPNV